MKSTRSCLLSFALAFSLIMGCLACSSSSYGVEIIDGNLTEIEIPTEQGVSADAIRFSSSPDHLRTFIYHLDEDPFDGLTVNTADCEDGHLYVVNVNNNQVNSVAEQAVMAYTTTKSNVYYVANNKIYQTDYYGGSSVYVCDVSNGTISNLDYFDGMLYFIHNWRSVVAVNVESGESSVVLEEPGMVSVFFYDHDKLVWRDT